MHTRWTLVVVAGALGCGAADAQSDGGADTSDGAIVLDASSGSDAPHANDAGAIEDGSNPNDGSVISPGTVGASPEFGFTVNTTSKYPNASYGTQRIWDSPPFQWGTLQTAACGDIDACANGYDATNMSSFDGYLAHLKTSGVGEVWYTMARTPHFATSAPNDSSCNYGGAGQGGLGQCDRPSDLADDGTGTNITFRKWYAFFAKRNNDATYLQTHAHIRFWEPWNEPDTAAFWGNGSGGHGSYDALVRMMQDAECLIVGTVGTGKITKTNETCAQVQATVGLTAPIDPTAIVVSPSYHAKSASLALYQNFLYCNNSPTSSCTSGDAGAKSMMAFNLHMKPGAECVANGGGTNCTTASSVEPAYAEYIKSFEGILQPAELSAFQSATIPLFDGEASYSPTGFVAPFDDQDLAASFITRFFLYGRSLGVMANEWYTWDSISGNTKVITAWNTLYDAWVGSSGASCSNAGTIYSCTFEKSGSSYEAMWDIAQDCSSGTCSTANQTVDSSWKTYRDLTGTAASCVTACNITGSTIPVGIKPVLLAK